MNQQQLFVTNHSREITILKGLLISLIVIGHNKIFTNSTGSFFFLYSFHVIGFFLLACLLNDRRKIPLALLSQKLKQYFYPYTIFFLACVLLYWMSVGDASHFPTWLEFLRAYVSGNAVLLRPVTGFSFLWFLPVLYAFYFCCVLHNSLSRPLQFAFSACFILALFGLKTFTPELLVNIPLGLPIVFLLLPVALINRKFLVCYNNNHYIYLFNIVFVALTVLFKPIEINIGTLLFPGLNPVDLIHFLWYQISMFSLLFFTATKLSNSKVLHLLGEHSLSIYLIHGFFNYAIIDVVLVKAGLYTQVSNNALVGLLIFSVVLLLSTMLSRNSIFKSVITFPLPLRAQ